MFSQFLGAKENDAKDESTAVNYQRSTIQIKKPPTNEAEKPTANVNQAEKPTERQVEKFMMRPCHSKSMEKLETKSEIKQKHMNQEIRQKDVKYDYGKKDVKQDEIRQKYMKQESQLESGSIEFDRDIWGLLMNKMEDLDLSDTEYDVHRQILNFRTLNVAESKNSIDDLIADIIHYENPLQIKENMREMLKQPQFTDVLDTRFNGYLHKYDVHCVLKETFIHLYGWDVDCIESTREELLYHFFQSVVIVNQNGMNADILRNEKSRLEHSYLVSISWLDSEAKTIQINGFSDDITMVTQELHRVMNKYKIRNESFEFTEDHSAYIEKHCLNELNNILQNITVLVNEERDKKLYIEFSGFLDKMNDISKALNQLKSDIKSEYIDVSSAFDVETSGLIIKALTHEDNPYCNKQENFENKFNCCIVTDITGISKPSKQRKKSLSEEDKTATADLVSFQLTVNLQLTIKRKGSIVDESADVLVCVLDEKLRLKNTRVGKAFLEKFSNLQSIVDGLDFSSNDVLLYTHQDKHMKCKAIAFLRLSRWSQDSAEDNFKLLISKVLTIAVKSQAKSIAFPPVGLGKMMKYPAELIAMQFCLAVKEHLAKAKGSKIQLAEIRIVANDYQLYNELQKESVTLKSLSPAQHLQKSMSNLGDDSPKKNAKFCIMHRNKMTLAPKWKEKLNCFEKDEFCLQSFGVSLENKIKEVLRLKVLTLSKHKTATGEWKLEIKGLKSHIQAISREIHSASQQSTHIISEDTPSRRTLDFLKHACSINELTPPYWKHKTKQDFERTPIYEVKVNKEVEEAIKKMFLGTWDSAKTGRGSDAENIPSNSTVEFVKVRRIENLSKFRSYASMRWKLLDKKCRAKKFCKRISEVSANKTESLIETYLPSEMKEQLCHEVNEYYLLHGTRSEIVNPIKHHGCDPKVSSNKAMLGSAVYATECSTKCDQYTDPKESRLPSGSVHHAFLIRILLGDIFVVDKSHEKLASHDCEKFKRPPCKRCSKDACRCINNRFYDSIMGEDLSNLLFREFCVYGAHDCYPEYLISYKRI